ncbi:MAG TPA: fused MFS/spermidine synthase [Candidatus Acidoferrales bacterium]|nr:fused MFS/spermidine synthase [Candidatus Acidoferrales bacterium]
MGTSPDEMWAQPRSKPQLQDETLAAQNGGGEMPHASARETSHAQQHPTRQKLVFGLAIFASAFLLFQVQPLITKIILPWFGGVAAVWTVCLVFFQVALLLGYLYAHVLASRFRLRTQARIHVSLLAVSFVALPILPKSSWKPVSSEAPAWHILMLLAVTVGLPYLVLSSTSPLLQAWYAQAREGAAPYRFYALSNIASMLALVSYPVLVEPMVSSTHQAVGWSVAYGVAAVLCAALALLLRGGIDREALANIAPAVDAPERPDWKTQTLWIALAACGSALLLAVTNHISQNIASVPFLWIIPLSLYLLSFILCFDREAWYRRGFFLRALGVALGGMAYALDPSFAILPMKVLIPLFCAGLWVCCMFCHGELARMKPHPAYLTRFYLMISLGGALGAVFVALVAPRVFSGYYELQCALGLCAVLVLVTQWRDPGGLFDKRRWQPAALVLVGLVIALIASLVVTVREQAAEARLTVRNFYGVLRVIDHAGANTEGSAAVPGQSPASRAGAPAVQDGHMTAYLSPRQTSYRRLMNGTIDHGLQFLSPALRRRPTSYYGPDSGIGVALKAIEKRGPLSVGVIGLGTGTIAAYGRTGDRYTFYEINPLDVRIAHEEFTFLRDSKAKIEIVPGDARLSLERETPQEFDLLAVDAFSSDSIPVHLLTRQAFQLYFRHLKPDGVLALHISNQYLNLQPVVEAAAATLGKEAVLISNEDDHAQGIYAAAWVLVGSRDGFAGQREIESAGAILLPAGRETVWTDDYSSVFRILK